MLETKSDAVWLACAIDTDGYGGIKRHKFKVKGYSYIYYLPAIGFSNSHRGIVEHFAKLIDGHVPPAFGPGVKGTKMKHSTNTHSTKKIKKILEKIIPYLIVKRERAEFILAYCNHRLATPGDHGRGISDRIKEDKLWYGEYVKRWK